MYNYDPPTDVIQADLDRIRQLTGENRPYPTILPRETNKALLLAILS